MDCTTTFSNLGKILENGCKNRRLNNGFSRLKIRTTRPLFSAFIKISLISILLYFLNSNHIIALCQELNDENLRYVRSSLFCMVTQYIAVETRHHYKIPQRDLCHFSFT